MVQFQVFRNSDAPGYLLDCQSDALAGLSARLVVPLQPPDIAPKPAGRLNPSFEIEGAPMVMVTQIAAAVPARELGLAVISLSGRESDIIGALDVLLTGV